MIHSEKISHIKGRTKSGCGASAFAMLFNISEELARNAVKTKADGTHTRDVLKAIKATGLTAHLISMGQDFYSIKDFLESMSRHFPIYASMEYRHSAFGGGRGRNKVEYHAVLFADGRIYDSAQNDSCIFDAYEYTHGKSLTVRDIIIVEEERPNYGKKNCLNNVI